MDRYYTPFITPKKGKSFTTREWNDIAAEHNQNIAVVPQILANQAEGFCKVAGMLKEQGYEEVNLNLGCPSATVTAKKKRLPGFWLIQTHWMRFWRKFLHTAR